MLTEKLPVLLVCAIDQMLELQSSFVQQPLDTRLGARDQVVLILFWPRSDYLGPFGGAIAEG
jgi:hypothetical protein